MAHEEHMRQKYISEAEAELALYLHLSQAESDIRLGRIQPANEAFRDILDDLKL